MKIAGLLLIGALLASPAAAQNSKYREAQKKESQAEQKADFWDARYTQYAIDSGYRDGFEQAKIDVLRSTARKDYTHDAKYRVATRGYQKKYGAQGYYQNYYREGFRRGYEEALRSHQASKRNSYNRATQKQQRNK